MLRSRRRRGVFSGFPPVSHDGASTLLAEERGAPWDGHAVRQPARVSTKVFTLRSLRASERRGALPQAPAMVHLRAVFIGFVDYNAEFQANTSKEQALWPQQQTLHRVFARADCTTQAACDT